MKLFIYNKNQVLEKQDSFFLAEIHNYLRLKLITKLIFLKIVSIFL